MSRQDSDKGLRKIGLTRRRPQCDAKSKSARPLVRPADSLPAQNRKASDMKITLTDHQVCQVGFDNWDSSPKPVKRVGKHPRGGYLYDLTEDEMESLKLTAEAQEYGCDPPVCRCAKAILRKIAKLQSK